MSQVNKVAILIDGGFFVARYNTLHKKGPRVSDLDVYIQDIMNRLKKLSCPDSEDFLFRIFYYDCRPYGQKEKNQMEQ